MSAEGSPGTTRAIIALGVIVLTTGAAFLLVGQYASREEGFDWELASLFGTAVGTVLLAAATGLLAWMTRAEVVASRQELALSRTAYQASTRPILVDAPLDRFTVEKEALVLPTPIEQGVPRRLEDLGRITVEAGYVAGPEGGEGYVRIAVPFHNVGAGLALIHDARLIGFETGWTIPWRRSSMQSAAPPGELIRISFGAEIDPGDGQALEMELDQLDELISFSVEVVYSDFGGEQRTRTRLAIEGRRSYWRVTHVELFDGNSSEPFVSLHREAPMVVAAETEGQAEG